MTWTATSKQGMATAHEALLRTAALQALLLLLAGGAQRVRADSPYAVWRPDVGATGGATTTSNALPPRPRHHQLARAARRFAARFEFLETYGRDSSSLAAKFAAPQAHATLEYAPAVLDLLQHPARLGAGQPAGAVAVLPAL